MLCALYTADPIIRLRQAEVTAAAAPPTLYKISICLLLLILLLEFFRQRWQTCASDILLGV